MSDAYLPGLTVSEFARVKKIRRLPLKGEVPVKVGDKVGPDTVVAQTFVPGRPHLLAVANLLNIEPGEVPTVMLKKVGDEVLAGEILASYRAFFGLLKGQCTSPVRGRIQHISAVTGQVVIREPAQPVAVKAYIAGRIARILPGEGVEVETGAALIQGIFGIGGEGSGKLRLAVKSPKEILSPRKIGEGDRGCILVGGSLITAAAMRKGEKLGVAGFIGGGVLDDDLASYLGYEIGVAITGQEDIPLSLVVTEGFGEIPMAAKTFALLRKLEGRQASINGSTQIRAGVLRPELVVPRGETGKEEATIAAGLELGSSVRLIRNPFFGKLGRVCKLPMTLEKIESEAVVRVVEIELEHGKRVTVPRANVEILTE